MALADELGMLVVGPNGQGVVSTPSSLCAQIVAPYPPAGRIGVASQSGNFVSSFMNYACASGIGISRAVSAGNAAMVGVTDFLRFYAEDPATEVALAYVEGLADGRAFFHEVAAVAERLPVVLVKGGATAKGQRAAASHTGSLATDDRVFDGMCRQAGVVRARSIEEAYEVAASFATQPPAAGQQGRGGDHRRWVGCGHRGRHRLEPDLELLDLPADLVDALDAELPPRWSRNNPIDLAGGETKDTIPTVIDVVVRHPEVDAVVLLGMGIQSNQGRMEVEGPFYPDWGLERIAAFHDRQDRRYAATAAALADELGKPVLVATELAVTFPGNGAVRGTIEAGKLCYPSADRAVGALSPPVGALPVAAATARRAVLLTSPGADRRGRRRARRSVTPPAPDDPVTSPGCPPSPPPPRPTGPVRLVGRAAGPVGRGGPPSWRWPSWPRWSCRWRPRAAPVPRPPRPRRPPPPRPHQTPRPRHRPRSSRPGGFRACSPRTRPTPR